MTLQAAAALLLLLTAGILAVRYLLRARCLGSCRGCPYAEACAKKKTPPMRQNPS